MKLFVHPKSSCLTNIESQPIGKAGKVPLTKCALGSVYLVLKSKR